MIPTHRIPTHPGEILLEEFLKPLGLSQAALARHLGIPLQRVNELVRGKRGLSPQTAWLLAGAFGTTPERLVTAIDGCGVETYAFRLREVAQAYAMLADPAAVPASDRRSELAPHLQVVRDAQLAHPDMVAGRHDRLDTSLMKAVPGRLLSKAGTEALRGIAILPGPRLGTSATGPSGLAAASVMRDSHFTELVPK